VRVADYQPPTWPDPAVPKQMHLDLAVDDLDAAEAEAIRLGARKPPGQPAPDRWRVLLDPAGHPFCLSSQIPK
jgi:Glyoxalase-like domain